MKKDYLSASSLKAFSKSPNHYLMYVNKTAETTPAMTFGSALHCFVLEPQEWSKRYAVAPAVDRRTKAGKIAFAEFVAENPEQEIITPADYSVILRMEEALKNNPQAYEMVNNATAKEQRCEMKLHGYDWLGYADGFSAVENHVFDIKTTQDSSPDSFMRTAYQMNYHEQAYLYCKMTGATNFYWIAMEKNAPYNVTVYRQTEDARIKAGQHVQQLTKKFIAWDGQPEGYSNQIIDINLPSWAK